MISAGVQKAVRQQFEFAVRNGGGDLSINGSTARVLVVEPPITESDNRPGRKRAIKRVIVGALKSEISQMPMPGTRASLDGWKCVVAEEGVEEEAHVWRITLRSP